MQRKKWGMISLGISSVMTFIVIFLKSPYDCDFCLELKIGLGLICIARFFIAMYFGIMSLYINELYPTKATGLGTSLIFGVGNLLSSLSPILL